MLDPARGAASEFVTAMLEARRVLSDASMNTLPALKTRRDALIERIATVNQQHADAVSASEEATSAYWAEYRDDPDSDGTSAAADDRSRASDALEAANAELSDVRREIEQLRSDIDTEESWIAGELGRISGGDVVRGAWGDELHTSQTFWGEADAAYPGGPVTRSGLAEHLRDNISDAVARRIEWLSATNGGAAQQWLLAHPDFAASVGFVDPERARHLFEKFENESVRGEDGTWHLGPLATLLAFAPAAIGNLNGIPATVKNEFNRKTLENLLAGDLTETQKRQLEQLERMLIEAEDDGVDVSLLSLFLNTTDDWSPRASVGFGDVDSADQITTLTHGIATDMSSLGEWSDSATNLKSNLDRLLGKSGSSATTATVLFFEWESGDPSNVWNIERPDAGAERLAQLLRGFELTNPGGQRNLGLHSLGTTAGTQMIVDNPDLVDNVWLYGSAGVTEETAAELEEMIRNHQISVNVTHATDDMIAPIGRWPVSEHPVDPRTIYGVDEFGSDGGVVDGYSDTPGGNYGERTEGHNSQASTEWYYLVEDLQGTPTSTGVPTYTFTMDDESVGYLDPRSQSFKQTVMDLLHALNETTRPR